MILSCSVYRDGTGFVANVIIYAWCVNEPYLFNLKEQIDYSLKSGTKSILNVSS